MPLEYLPPTNHPSVLILNELVARNWTINTLLVHLGWPREALPALLDLLQGKVDIDVPIAEALANAFGTSLTLWIELQAQHDVTPKRRKTEWHTPTRRR